MLSLRTRTPPSFVQRVEANLGEVLIDHAHCEKKAAGAAMSLIFAYVEFVPVATALADVVKEELTHFQQVLALLERRGIEFRGQPQSPYGQRLAAHIRRNEPEKAIDRCLVAALIEARSCERFQLLRDHLQDAELRAFYGSLLESEARHHALYVRLASHFANEPIIRTRLDVLSEVEASILQTPSPLPRLHS